MNTNVRVVFNERYTPHSVRDVFAQSDIKAGRAGGGSTP